ncbi:hypothetical protein ABC657_08735 [Lentilactobacillus parabuchneri]|uniref:hypothetical protein n=1 Tax=Lentilactobacillus parabuchneri TaxID=152331 RepID=UPI0031D40A5B
MIKTYRKTKMIKAEQFDGSQKMIKKYGIEDSTESGYNDSDWEDEGLCIPTKEGYLRINNGDWVATGIDGEHWPIADDVFRKTYAKLPVISRVWADTIEEYKANHYRLSEIFTEWDLGYGGQEVIARAWLDGYQVEADK